MALNAGSLFEIAIALGVLALILHVNELPEQPGAWVAVRQALAGFSGQLALVALLAAAVLQWLPLWRPAGLAELNVAQLQETQRSFTTIAERAWWLPMALALLALGAGAIGWHAIDGVRARVLGQTLAGTLWLKSLAALVALFGVSAVGLQQRAAASAALVQEQRARLVELRITLANDAARAALLAIARPLVTTVPATLDWPGLADAYWAAEPVLAVPDGRARANPPRQAMASRVRDAMPDLSAQALEGKAAVLQQVHRQATEPSQRLMSVVLEAAFDNAMVDPLRSRVLELGNPVLNELLSVMLDPVVVAPLRQAVVETAVAAFRGGGAEAMQQRANQSVAKLPAQARQRLRSAMARASGQLQAAARGPLGIPKWDAVRINLAERLRSPGTGREGAALMQSGLAWRPVQRLWRALDRLLVSDRARSTQPEPAFARLLLAPSEEVADRRAAMRLAMWGAAIGESQGLRTPTGEPDAGAGLLQWAAALPPDLAKQVKERVPSQPASATALAAEQMRAAKAGESAVRERMSRAGQGARPHVARGK